MLDTLITSKTRIKLLLKFFLNSQTESYLRGLEQEFDESSNSIRQELNRFEKAGLLTSRTESNRKLFRANAKHPLFQNIQDLVRKYIGIDHIIEKVIGKLGDPEEVYLTGDFAKGIDGPIIDLIIIGSNINVENLARLCHKAEEIINRKIRYMLYTSIEFKKLKFTLLKEDVLLIWKK